MDSERWPSWRFPEVIISRTGQIQKWYKISEMSVGKNSSAGWWCCVSRVTLRAESSPTPKMYRRHSSPEIKSTASSVRSQSPTFASPMRHQSGVDLNVVNALKKVRQEKICSGCAGSGDVYFASQPPAAPVLVLPARPGAACAFHNACYNPKSIWRPEGNHCELDSVPKWITPRLMSSPPPRNSGARKSRSRATQSQIRRKDDPESRRAVLRILRGLIISLPLPPEANRLKNVTAEDPHAGVVNAAIYAPAIATPITRSVSVQAKSEMSSIKKGKYSVYGLETDIDDGLARRRPAAGWAGGARALRDSHVRLVLRQLRHIERLNRALDHVSVADKL